MNLTAAVIPSHRNLSFAGLSDLVWGRRVAIVVETDHLDRAGAGAEIDAHDVVIRFGDFATHPTDLGTMTSLHLSGTQWCRRLHEPVAARVLISGRRHAWERAVSQLTVPGAQGLLGDSSLRWPCDTRLEAILQCATERLGHPITTLLTIVTVMIRDRFHPASVSIFGVCDDPQCRCSQPSVHARTAKVIDLGQELKAVILGAGRRDDVAEVPASAPATERVVAPSIERSPLLQSGSDLIAASRYAEALEVLRPLAASDLADEAAAVAAEIHWVCNDEIAARRAGVSSLRFNPTNGRAQVILERLGRAARRRPSTIDDTTMIHAAFHPDRWGNFGDQVLIDATKDAFGASGHTWSPLHVHQRFSTDHLEQVNRATAVVVGGGGLLMSDTARNATSGWQWNIDQESLAAIKVPIVGAALGLNDFPGQDLDTAMFRASLETFASSSIFIGVRERSGVERLCELLPDELHDRIRYFPCPTTLPEHLGLRSGTGITHADPFSESPFDSVGLAERPIIVLNVAMDRTDLRYGSGYPALLEQIAALAHRLEDQGIALIHASHHRADDRFVDDLDRHHGVMLHRVGLHRLERRRALSVYRHASVVIGSRTHSTALPIGLGTPVIGLISHDKVAAFMADTGRDDWTVRATESDLAEQLGHRIEQILSDPTSSRRSVNEIQDRFRNVIEQRVAEFHDAIGSDHR